MLTRVGISLVVVWLVAAVCLIPSGVNGQSCPTTPCQNNGTCVNNVCQCQGLYWGTFCGIAPCTNFTALAGYDYYGNDLTNQAASTWDACVTYCESVKGCEAMTWIYSTCYAKSGGALYSMSASSSAKTGGCAAYADNPDSLCNYVVCPTNAMCKGGICICTGGYSGSTCTTAPPAGVCTQFNTSFVNKNFAANQLAQDGGGTLDVCIAKCQQRSTCMVVSMDASKQCYFHTSQAYFTGATASTGYQSAVCQGLITYGNCFNVNCNNGTCVNGACVCNPGYSGTYCTTAPAYGWCQNMTTFANSDFYGNDIPSMNKAGSSLDACIRYCQSVPGCLAVTLSYGNCYAKYGAALLSIMPSSGVSCAGCAKYLDNPDLLCVGVTCPTQAICLGGNCLCTGGYSGSTCTTPPPAGTCLSFNRSFVGKNFASNQISQDGGGTMDACIYKCQQTSNCMVVSMDASKQCYFHTSASYFAGATTNANYQSAVCQGVITQGNCFAMQCNNGTCVNGACVCDNGFSGTNCLTKPAAGWCTNFTRTDYADYYGNDISNTGVSSWDACVRYCQSVSGCQAFTWIVGGNCYAKRTAALVSLEAYPSGGRVAGGCSALIGASSDVLCQGVTCPALNARCVMASCQCLNGYSGTDCTTVPPAGMCYKFNTSIINTDYQNNLISQDGGYDLDVCIAKCQALSGCMLTTFSTVSRQCYFHQTAAVWTPTTIASYQAAVCWNLTLNNPRCFGVQCGPGSCDPSTGLCVCAPGVSGSQCSVPAPADMCTAFTQYTDSDYYGNDIANTNVANYAACQQFCQQTATCKAFTFRSSGSCFAKTGAALASRVSSSGQLAGGCTAWLNATSKQLCDAMTTPCTASIQFCVMGTCICRGGYTGTNCATAPPSGYCTSFNYTVGVDYTTNLITQDGGLTMEVCVAKCQQRADCKVVTMDTTTNQCYFHQTPAYYNPSPVAGYSAGICTTLLVVATGACKGNFTEFTDYDYYGNDLSNAAASSFDGCVAYCKSVAGCNAFTYIPGGNCYAKGTPALASLQTWTGRIAGGCTDLLSASSDVLCQGVTCPALNARCVMGSCQCLNGYSGTDCTTVPPAGMCYKFNTTIVNTDYENNFIAQDGGYDLDVCIAKCQQRSGCMVTTFNTQSRQCYFHQTAAAWTPMTYAGYQAALCFNLTLPGAACVGVNCGTHGYCSSGVCVCVNGYSGTQCTTAPAAGFCQNFTRFVDHDYYGNDISNAAATSYQQCVQYCWSVPNCNAFTYAPDINGGYCYAKTAAALVSLESWSGRSAGGCTALLGASSDQLCIGVTCPLTNAECVMGQCICLNGYSGSQCTTAPPAGMCYLFNTTITNTDYQNNLLTQDGGANLDVCIAKCQQRSGCMVVTFNTVSGQCYFHQSAAAWTPISYAGYKAALCYNLTLPNARCQGVTCLNKGYCVEGVCKCINGYGGTNCATSPPSSYCAIFNKYPQTTFPGNTISTVTTATSIDECILSCQSTSGCEVVSFTPPNTCALKYALAFVGKTASTTDYSAACANISATAACTQTCSTHTRCAYGSCVCTDGYSGLACTNNVCTCPTTPAVGTCSGSYTTLNGIDLVTGEISSEGAVDMAMCISKCQAKLTCVAVTLDSSSVCHLRTAIAISTRWPDSTKTSATCDSQTSSTICQYTNCNTGYCAYGTCFCLNGYSGTYCATSAPSGSCANFVESNATVSTSVTALTTSDAISLADCESRCHANANCRVATFRKFSCSLYAEAAASSLVASTNTIAAQCGASVVTVRYRLLVAYSGTTQQQTAFTTNITRALSTLGVATPNYALTVTYVTAQAQVVIGCKLTSTASCDAALQQVNNTIKAANPVGALGSGVNVVGYVQIWCNNLNDYAVSCSAQPQGSTGGAGPSSASSSSSSLSGGAVAGIVIAAVAVAVLGVGILWFVRQTSQDSKAMQRARRSTSGNSKLQSTLELNQVSGSNTPTGSVGQQPVVSAYAVGSVGGGGSTAAYQPPAGAPGSPPVQPPLPPLPRM